MNNKSPRTLQFAGFFFELTGSSLEAAEAGVDGAEHVSDQWSEDHQRSNNNDSNQNENERVFHEALTFFLGGK